MSFNPGHALVIGVGTYQAAPRWNVPITARDADAVADVLRNSQLCGYPADQVKLLVKEAATREHILAEFTRLAGVVAEEQTVVVFYCGHGEYSADGTYHLSTHDTRLTGENKIEAGTAISHHELIQCLQAIKAKRVLLIFNACHAGTISPDKLGGASADDAGIPGQALPASTASALLSTGSGRIIITACREDQFSYIGDGALTRFTTALVNGLSGRGDVTNRGGYISAYDLYLHTYYAVRDISARFKEEQEPELTVLKGVGPFAVALYRGASTLGSFDESAPIPTSDGAVRAVQPERSRAAMTTIMSQIAGRDLTNIDARNSQGFINQSSGPVHQVFDSRNVNTGGGDYAEGDIDKRKGD